MLLRAERRRQGREQAAYLMQQPITGQPAEPDWDSLRPMLDDLINELNEGDRLTLILRFFEGCTLSQVGNRLDLTERGAQARVQRALDKLSTRLVRRGVKSTAAALSTVLATQAVVALPADLAATVTGAAMKTAAGAGTSLTFLTFMNSKIISTLVLALIVGAALLIEHRVAVSQPVAAIVAPHASTAAAFPPAVPKTTPEPNPATPPIPPTPGPAATEDPQLNLNTAIPDMIKVLSTQGFGILVLRYVQPDVLTQLPPTGLAATEIGAALNDPAILAKTQGLLKALQSIQDVTPVYNAAGDEATYTPPEQPGGQGAPPKGIVFIKQNGRWYLKGQGKAI